MTMQHPDSLVYSPFDIMGSPYKSDIETGLTRKDFDSLQKKLDSSISDIVVIKSDLENLRESYEVYKGYSYWSFTIVKTLIVILFFKAFNVF